MHPDQETQVAYRDDNRLAARLIRNGTSRARLDLPEEPDWHLMPGAEGGLEGLQAEPAPSQPLGPGQVRVEVDAVGLNFLDVLLSMGVVNSADPKLGEEFCGRIVQKQPRMSRTSPWGTVWSDWRSAPSVPRCNAGRSGCAGAGRNTGGGAGNHTLCLRKRRAELYDG